jgi:hypothetical protein
VGNVVPLVFAAVILITFVLLMVDLSTGRRRREAPVARSKPSRRSRASRTGAYASTERAPYRY